uniref:Peroxisomal carnitine O-octanoyltransferase-like n=1 Tax=Phallusia mammillata TaxID=59560 RepID=A0A6F9DAV3_9ASCI|nr:peroxisomal carnitine O-octanoyltransferase-like [Phallusia mammillata]
MSKGTFGYEDSLPDLKVPQLQNTIEKYLDSVRALANDSEYENTKQVCRKFLEQDASKLQEYLKNKEKDHRNWVEKLWLDKGYLELRMPLPYMNFTGTPSYAEQFWPPQDGTQIERMAFCMHILSLFYRGLRAERLEVHRGSGGTVFSMDQCRTAFNTCQTPHRGKDELNCYFKTVSEGQSPTHVIVIYKGYLFKMDLYSKKTGKGYTPPQFEKSIEQIVEICNNKKTEAPGMAALTSLNRDKWADVREHLISLSPVNKQNLSDIDTAVGVFTMDDHRADVTTEIMYNVLCGNPINRWRDKSHNEVWSRNGTVATSCAHSAIDGMVMVMYMEFSTAVLKKCNGKWTGSFNTDDVSPVEELKFELSDVVSSAIEEGKKIAYKFNDDLWLKNIVYTHFGKNKLKQLKIYPDAIVQTSIQLAYMRLHGAPASTYETATTRQFYHGRTETCRTCTPELVAFCMAAIKSKNNRDQHVWSLLRAAHAKFVHLMQECKNNRGCDRHLFGLAVAAGELGLPMPDLFTDPMYTKTGGGGNFTLSTSFVGFFNSSGVVAPMLDDGYGCFYRIIDDSVVCTMTSWRYSKQTNLTRFSAYLEQALQDVYEMFVNMNDSKL